MISAPEAIGAITKVPGVQRHVTNKKTLHEIITIPI